MTGRNDFVTLLVGVPAALDDHHVTPLDAFVDRQVRLQADDVLVFALSEAAFVAEVDWVPDDVQAVG